MIDRGAKICSASTRGCQAQSHTVSATICRGDHDSFTVRSMAESRDRQCGDEQVDTVSVPTARRHE